jgi:SAM-dependent methyltransferase
MDDLRAAVATALAPTPAPRLIAIDAEGLVDGAAFAVYAAVGPRGTAAPRAVVADPLRLPFVAAIADAVVVRTGTGSEPPARWREIWRVLAPAGTLVVVVPIASRLRLQRFVLRQLARRRLRRTLGAAMFEVVTWQTVAGGIVIRAAKRDGLAPHHHTTAMVRAAVTT